MAEGASGTSAPLPAREDVSSRRRDGVKVAAYLHDLRTRVMRCPCLAVVLLVGVAVLDTFRASATLGLLVDGVTDEVAHLSTALLVLLAVAGPARLDRHRVEVATTLLASVAIDLDHLPLYAGVPGAAEGGRPASHSVSTVVLLALAAVWLRRARPVLLAAAAGIGLHLLRDLSTGPGVPLLWPLSTEHVRLPYGPHLALLCLLAAVAVLRNGRRSRVPLNACGQSTEGARSWRPRPPP